jgi:hypothetical protein
MYRPLERTMEYYGVIDVATGREKKKLLVTEAEVKQLVLSLPYSGKTLRKQVLKALRESQRTSGTFNGRAADGARISMWSTVSSSRNSTDG